MTPSLTSLEALIAALDACGVAYLVGGSVASSFHGIPRATMDVDILAAINPSDAEPLSARLREDFVIFEDEMLECLRSGRPFNLIHRTDVMKFDIFTPQCPFHWSELERAQIATVSFFGKAVRVRIASPEDMLIAKLAWFRDGGESSQRQWSDVLGLMKGGLDGVYLTKWAVEMGVAALLERAGREVHG